MKYKILLSVFSLITTVILTLVCWWICGSPKVQSDVDAFLLMLIEIILYNTLKLELIRKDDEL